MPPRGKETASSSMDVATSIRGEFPSGDSPRFFMDARRKLAKSFGGKPFFGKRTWRQPAALPEQQAVSRGAGTLIWNETASWPVAKVAKTFGESRPAESVGEFGYPNASAGNFFDFPQVSQPARFIRGKYAPNLGSFACQKDFDR